MQVMRLSLLRSPKAPDPDSDMGMHAFTYAFYPHASAPQHADVQRHAAELNAPLIVAQDFQATPGQSIRMWMDVICEDAGTQH